MKIDGICSSISSSEGYGFHVHGEYAEIAKCMEELNHPKFSHIKTAPLNKNSHTLYFKHDTSDMVLAEVQYQLHLRGIETNCGFLHPSLIGWGNLSKKFGFALVKDNWGRIISDFLLGQFLLGNNGYNKPEAFVMTLSYISFIFAMIGITAWFDSLFITIPVAIVAVVSFSFTASASLPRVGDVNLNGFLDDGVLWLLFGVLFLIVTVIAIWLIPSNVLPALFLPFCFWFGFRSATRISPRDTIYG